MGTGGGTLGGTTLNLHLQRDAGAPGEGEAGGAAGDRGPT